MNETIRDRICEKMEGLRQSIRCEEAVLALMAPSVALFDVRDFGEQDRNYKKIIRDLTVHNQSKALVRGWKQDLEDYQNLYFVWCECSGEDMTSEGIS